MYVPLVIPAKRVGYKLVHVPVAVLPMLAYQCLQVVLTFAMESSATGVSFKLKQVVEVLKLMTCEIICFDSLHYEYEAMSVSV